MKKTIYWLAAAPLCLATLALTGCDEQNDVKPLESEQVDETPAETPDEVQPPAEQPPPGRAAPGADHAISNGPCRHTGTCLIYHARTDACFYWLIVGPPPVAKSCSAGGGFFTHSTDRLSRVHPTNGE